MATTAHSNGEGALAELAPSRGEEAYVERVLRHAGDRGEDVRGIGVTEPFNCSASQTTSRRAFTPQTPTRPERTRSRSSA